MSQADRSDRELRCPSCGIRTFPSRALDAAVRNAICERCGADCVAIPLAAHVFRYPVVTPVERRSVVRW